jgi:hypothetical protein
MPSPHAAARPGTGQQAGLLSHTCCTLPSHPRSKGCRPPLLLCVSKAPGAMNRATTPAKQRGSTLAQTVSDQGSGIQGAAAAQQSAAARGMART